MLVVRGETGGANRDRTGDLLLAKQALSQLSYGPRPLAKIVFDNFCGYHLVVRERKAWFSFALKARGENR